MRFNALIALIILILSTSCSFGFKKYQSNWVLNKFIVDGKDAMEIVTFYNFTINVALNQASTPALDLGVKGRKRKDLVDIKLLKMSGKDYITILDDSFFEGTYEIKCLYQNCCSVSMENDKIYLEMDYNGDLPHGITRKCQSPRLPEN